ncbi:ATP-binding protein [Roseateles sp.]|uniref:ATP-binding protein n=1 Tax=Roseateles sp. TaxID=1971397 RepID=UPI003265324B
MNPIQNRRILLVDDMPTIHEDFRKILLPPSAAKSALDAAKAALFDDEVKSVEVPFELDSAYQGEEGLAKVQASLGAGRPYAMAFVDMRMPPGWDGVETIEHLWRVDPRLQVVICTAYSDTSWEEVLTRLDARDRLLILKKPFDNIEVRQLASALTAKWESTQQAGLQIDQLEAAVEERTVKLVHANEALQAEMSERLRRESQLVQSEKLASIGQLAAGVAHEINNPIGFVCSNFGAMQGYFDNLMQLLGAYERAAAQLNSPATTSGLARLREDLQLDYLKEDMPGLMRESREGIERVRAIVQDLREFSQVDSAQEWRLANLHQGINSTLNIVASEVRQMADIVKTYGQIPEIECLASQINQVVMNLVVNAAHAMGSERGCITVSTGTEDDHVWIEVADTGCGIAAQHLSRIFDPFFTTKPVGKGTGLGLSLSYGIVQRHHGRIEVQSRVGEGTTFRIVLPVRQPSH